MGGEGKVVEVDETYFGNIPEAAPPFEDARSVFQSEALAARWNKRAIISLVERGGEVRSFHVPRAHVDSVVKIVRENIDRETGCIRMKADSTIASATNLPRTKPSIIATKNMRAAT